MHTSQSRRQRAYTQYLVQCTHMPAHLLELLSQIAPNSPSSSFSTTLSTANACNSNMTERFRRVQAHVEHLSGHISLFSAQRACLLSG
jgi:hypothetical protein